MSAWCSPTSADGGLSLGLFGPVPHAVLVAGWQASAPGPVSGLDPVAPERGVGDLEHMPDITLVTVQALNLT